MIAAIILSSLALAAATWNLAMTHHERKRNLERNAAQINYADKLSESVLRKTADAVTSLENNINQQISKQNETIELLKSGIVPDFEKAKEAANAVNSFNSGICGILGFDPYDALKASREKESGGE